MSDDVTVEGGVRMHIAESLSPDDLARWSPERIAQFFDGVRQVVAAAEGQQG